MVNTPFLKSVLPDLLKIVSRVLANLIWRLLTVIRLFSYEVD